MTTSDVEGLLRELAPQALGAVARRYGEFVDAEDAVQEALVTAAAQWPADLPDRPLSWLITVASRRLVDEYRRTDARRRREELAASLSIHQQAATVPGSDDSLVMLFLCCDEALSPTLSIPLTLRAVAGLTTREIAAAYLVPEATMAQRISRAKAGLRGRRFALPLDPASRVRSVCEVLYLLFNEGYTSSNGPDLSRVDLAGEAVRLARMLHSQVREVEVAGLLSLMLLTEARRPARTSVDGALVPLAQQDRSLWDRALIGEGLSLLNATLAAGRIGEYQLLASIAALHDEAASYASTRWEEIVKAYAKLETLTGNPVVRLNRAVAVARVDGPAAGLALLEGLELRDSHRLHAVRAHLLEEAGDLAAAGRCYAAAASRTNNARERDYLVEQAARVSAR